LLSGVIFVDLLAAVGLPFFSAWVGDLPSRSHRFSVLSQDETSPSVGFPTHLFGRRRPFGIERLLPTGGFFAFCLSIHSFDRCSVLGVPFFSA
jgi:hypothetical protein